MEVHVIQKPDGGLEAITVGELKKMLAGVPASAIVVLASDAEGNQHHPLMEVATSHVYFRQGRYDGEIIDLDGGDAVVRGDQPCVLLVPMD